jgi:hypothetical protein
VQLPRKGAPVSDAHPSAIQQGQDKTFFVIIDDPIYASLEDTPHANVARMVSDLANRTFRGRTMNGTRFKEFLKGEIDTYTKLIVAVLDHGMGIAVSHGEEPLERFEDLVESYQAMFAQIKEDKRSSTDVVWVAVLDRLAHLDENGFRSWNKVTGEAINVIKVHRERGDSAT